MLTLALLVSAAAAAPPAPPLLRHGQNATLLAEELREMPPPHAEAEEQAWRAWAQRVEVGAKEPDGWWLKTCAGWSALMLCGAVFGAEIDEPTARAEDVGELFGAAATSVVDYERRAVDTKCAWNFTETVP